jgi:hypothetical protein
MTPTFDPAKDVIVRVRPAVRQRTGNESGRQIYDAFVYSPLTLVTPSMSSGTNFPQSFRDIPLAGIEQITVQPTSHQAYLASFLEGEKGLSSMRDRLLETMSNGLRNLLTKPSTDLRIWWSSSAPELDDFPWELTANSSGIGGAPQIVLLRGAPPETPIPVLPVDQSPRLAIMGAINRRPDWVNQLCAEFPQIAKPFNIPLRDALRQAAREGFELVHVFSDGIVSNALDGVLYDHDATSSRPELPPGELSNMLAGTRIAVLALSQANDTSPDALMLAGRSVLSAFRAFAYLGASNLPLPTVIAPLGPIPDEVTDRFWLTFYKELVTRWHLTRSLQEAQKSFSIGLPVALFCRHAAGRLFQLSESVAPVDNERMEVRQDFLQSQQLYATLAHLGKKYSNILPRTVKEYMTTLEDRQTRLRETLDGWKPPGEEL